MRVDNEAYAILNAQSDKRPRFTVRFSFDTDDTELFYITSHADGVFAAGGNGLKNCIPFGGITGQTQKVDPVTAISTIGGITVKAQDIGNAIRQEISFHRDAGRGMRGKKVVIYVGFEGMAWTDYEKRHTYIVDDIAFIDGKYVFSLVDIQREQRKKIFKPKQLTLRAGVDSNDLYIPVSGTDLTIFQTVWHDSSYTVHPSQFIGYVELNDEVIAHTGMVDHVTHGISIKVASNGRGAFGTRAVRHTVQSGAGGERQSVIKEFIVIAGSAPKIIHALNTGEIYGTANKLPSHWNLGIDPSFIRTSDYLNIGSDIWDGADDGTILRFWGVKETDGKKFIEKEILRWINCFTPVYADGTIGLKRLQRVLSGSGTVEDLDETNVTKYGRLSHALRKILNVINIEWNYDFKVEKFLKTSPLVDENSIDIHGESDSVTYKFLGVQTNNTTEDAIRQAFDGIRDRYSGEPMLIDVSILPSMNTLEVGDVVNLNLPLVEDFNAGGSLNRPFEVQQSSTDWINGNYKLNLFASSQESGELAPLDAQFSLDNAFYLEGISLNSLPTISGGTVNSDTTLTGGNTTMTTYFVDSDLTVPFGVNLFIEDNVELRVKGTWVLNGKVNGKGRGGNAGAGQTALGGNPVKGEVAFGNTRSGGMIVHEEWAAAISNRFYFVKGIASYKLFNSVVSGIKTSLGIFKLRNKNGFVTGLPTSLKGSGGSGGGALIERIIFGSSGGFTDPPYRLLANGSTGGRGGAGLSVIARGFAFGGGAVIDLSGADGVSGIVKTSSSYPAFIHSASSAGGGGHTGGLCLFVDGDAAAPDPLNVAVCDNGKSETAGTNRLTSNYVKERISIVPVARSYYKPMNPTSVSDNRNGSIHVQYIPRVESLSEPSLVDINLPSPSLVTLQSGNAAILFSGDGTAQPRIKVEWDYDGQTSFIGQVEVQSKRTSESASEWRVTALSVVTIGATSDSIYFDAEAGIAYDVRVRFTPSGSSEAANYLIRGGEVISSAFVDSLNHLVVGDETPPVDVTGFSFSRTGADKALLSWSDNAENNISHYEIRVGATLVSSTLVVRAFTNKHELTGLVSGVTYKYWIIAVNKSRIESDVPASLDITLQVPSVVTGFDFSRVGKTSTDLFWNNNDESEYISHYRLTKGDVFGTSVLVDNIKSNVRNIQNLEIGLTAKFWIVAVDFSGGDSDEVSVDVILNIPDPILNLDVDVGVGQFSLSWEAPLDDFYSGYELRSDGADWDGADIIGKMNAEFYQSSKLSSGSHLIRIKTFIIGFDKSVNYSSEVTREIFVRKNTVDLTSSARLSSSSSADAVSFGESIACSFDSTTPMLIAGDSRDTTDSGGNGIGRVQTFSLDGDVVERMASIPIPSGVFSRFGKNILVSHSGTKLVIFSEDTVSKDVTAHYYRYDVSTAEFVLQSSNTIDVSSHGGKGADSFLATSDLSQIVTISNSETLSSLDREISIIVYELSGSSYVFHHVITVQDFVYSGFIKGFAMSDDGLRLIVSLLDDGNTVHHTHVYTRSSLAANFAVVQSFAEGDFGRSDGYGDEIKSVVAISGNGEFMAMNAFSSSPLVTAQKDYIEFYKFNSSTGVYDYISLLERPDHENDIYSNGVAISRIWDIFGRVGSFDYTGSEFYIGAVQTQWFKAGEFFITNVGKYALCKLDQSTGKDWVYVNTEIQPRLIKTLDFIGSGGVIHLRRLKSACIGAPNATDEVTGNQEGQVFLFNQKVIEGE